MSNTFNDVRYGDATKSCHCFFLHAVSLDLFLVDRALVWPEVFSWCLSFLFYVA
jgi:hypothetical protein